VESLKPPITCFSIVNWLQPFSIKLCIGWVYLAMFQIQQMSMLYNFVIFICLEKKFVKVFMRFGWLVVELFERKKIIGFSRIKGSRPMCC
jgi:hypothetical protein